MYSIHHVFPEPTRVEDIQVVVLTWWTETGYCISSCLLHPLPLLIAAWHFAAGQRAASGFRLARFHSSSLLGFCDRTQLYLDQLSLPLVLCLSRVVG